MSRRHNRLSAAVAVLAGMALVARAAPRTPLGADTPQALVERMVKAADAKNFGEIVACLDPDSRTEATLGLLMGTAMMVAFMEMGSGMASDMARGMAEAVSGEGLKPEDKAKIEKGKAEAAAKAAKMKASFSALLEKHGLPDLTDPSAASPQSPPDKLLAGVDQPALAADLLGFMEQLGDKKEAKEKAGPPIPRNATDYKIAGDRATAKAGGETIEFVKIDGRWFFKPPQKDEKK